MGETWRRFCVAGASASTDHWRGVDCLLELSNSPIAHNREFGHGSEKENLRAEKEYETAAAKGFRPCPTCKKMTNLQSNAVFKAFAFEPTPQELEDAIREHRRNKCRAKKRKAKPEPEPEPERDIIILDSDDEMPSFEDILAGRTDKKPKREEDEMDDDTELDLTMNDISGDPSAKLKRLKAKKEHSDDDEDSTDVDEKEPDAPSDKLINTWCKGDHDMEPSAKLMKLVDFVNEWDVTGDKTIVYSQWTSMLDLVEVMFSRMGIQSLRYDGKLSREQRDQVISTFRQSGGLKVMLISTKCGGVGLNLVSANRIINLDLSWNYAAEAQAYARVHRVGQEKSVYVRRLVVRDTLEERMLHLQDVKTGLAETALGEGTGAKLHKFSVKEIKLLFGIKPRTEREGAGKD